MWVRPLEASIILTARGRAHVGPRGTPRSCRQGPMHVFLPFCCVVTLLLEGHHQLLEQGQGQEAIELRVRLRIDLLQVSEQRCELSFRVSCSEPLSDMPSQLRQQFSLRVVIRELLLR